MTGGQLSLMKVEFVNLASMVYLEPHQPQLNELTFVTHFSHVDRVEHCLLSYLTTVLD